MKVLVTGATGRVGANMVRRLLAEGAEVRAMAMPDDPQLTKLDAVEGVEVVEASLTDLDAIDKACQGVTHVVHLAAQMLRGDTPVDRFFDINSLGTLRLLEGVIRNGGVERFVLTSTDGTYRPGDPPSVPLPEDTPQEPADYYGTSKLLGEVILRNHAAQFDIPFAITRFATVVSPEEAGRIFTRGYMRGLVAKAELGKNSNIWQLFREHPDVVQIFEAAVGAASDDTPMGFLGPDGPWTIHLVDVRDAVDGVYLALTHSDALGKAFNITAAAPTPHDEGAAVLSELVGKAKVMVDMPMTWRLEMAVERARDVLGYQPQYDYRSMVESGRAAGGSYIPAVV